MIVQVTLTKHGINFFYTFILYKNKSNWNAKHTSIFTKHLNYEYDNTK